MASVAPKIKTAKLDLRSKFRKLRFTGTPPRFSKRTCQAKCKYLKKKCLRRRNREPLRPITTAGVVLHRFGSRSEAAQSGLIVPIAVLYRAALSRRCRELDLFASAVSFSVAGDRRLCD
jgi:hypothetical protein